MDVSIQVTAFILLLVGCLRAQVTAPPGMKGAKGLPGAKGPSGMMGEKGEAGDPGEVGATGSTGALGSIGVAGAPGPQGEKGTLGDGGVTGIEGPTGESGVVGATGEQGATGATGATGPTGQTGATGAVGDTGNRGDFGVKGRVGEPGEKGEKGAEGIQGATGDSGAEGSVGVQGPSLKELDVNECAPQSDNGCDPTSTQCINWATGYRCICRLGFKPSNTSEFACEDIDECAVENGDCSGKCINTVGGYECECPVNTRVTQNKQCADINECIEGTANCAAGDNSYCINNYNGFSCAISQASVEATTAKASVAAAQTLSQSMMTSTWVIALLIWLAILTFIAIIILIWLIYVFHKMRTDKIRRQGTNMYDAREDIDDGSEDEMQLPEGMAGSTDVYLDLPRPPRSHRGTMKGATGGRKSYKGGSKPGSVSSSTGKEMKTASIKQTRVATGERTSANRLSQVDTYY